jgi:phage virion morphogenesis protein
MTGVVVETDVSVAAAALGRLNDAQLAQLMYEVGALIEDQTKLRIADEKTSPEGAPWAPWSARYAGTRNAKNSRRHSLLVGEGDLRDSIQNFTTGLEAVVGSNLIYAATHQFGDAARNIPARPYLGLSADNRTAIEELVAGRIEDLLQ